jgi:hypothetical protein
MRLNALGARIDDLFAVVGRSEDARLRRANAMGSTRERPGLSNNSVISLRFTVFGFDAASDAVERGRGSDHRQSW